MANVSIDRLLGSLARSNNRDLQYAQLDQQAEQADANRGLALTQQAGHLAPAIDQYRDVQEQDAMARARQNRLDAEAIAQARARENRLLQDQLADQKYRQEMLKVQQTKAASPEKVATIRANTPPRPRTSGGGGKPSDPVSFVLEQKRKEKAVLDSKAAEMQRDAFTPDAKAMVQAYRERSASLQAEIGALQDSLLKGKGVAPPQSEIPPMLARPEPEPQDAAPYKKYIAGE